MRSWKLLHLVMIGALLCGATLFDTGLAQDIEPGAQPPTPIGGIPDVPPDSASGPAPSTETLAFPETRDLSSVCRTMAAQPASSTGARPSLVDGTDLEGYDLSDGRIAVQANIALPPGSLLTAMGPAAWVSVTEGAIAIVSCGSDLIFDLTQNDNTQYSLPAGTALIVDPLVANGVLLALDEMVDWAWFVQLGDGATSIVSVDAEIGSNSNILCDRLGCWTIDQVDFTADGGDPPGGGTVTGGGGCGMVRCWSR